ncbi:MAG TPA: sigma-70 family RNA polymerase sigma factor [Parasegetibacter sp.]
MEENNDLLLLMGLAANDEKAVKSIYKQYYNMVQTMILNNSGSADDARDVFQETIMVLYEKVKTGRFELNSLLKTYLYSVARRIWLKKLQLASKQNNSIEFTDEPLESDDELEMHRRKEMDFMRMELAMKNLGEPCRRLLEAYYVHQQNMVEIARNFGYTNADNAKNQKYKCLMRLKKIFFSRYIKTGE